MITSSKPSGFTIIELLVTLFILSISLLGVSYMQVVSLKASDQANARSQARAIGTELMEQLRASRVMPGDLPSPDSPANPATACASRNNIADYVNCLNHFASSLPGGTSNIEQNATENTFTITISWRENRSARREGETEQNNNCTNNDCLNSLSWTIQVHPHSRFTGS